MTAAVKNSPDIEKWLKLIRCDGVGSVTFARLKKYFGSVDAALEASLSQLTQVAGIGEKTARTIVSSRDKFNIEAELEIAEKVGVCLLTLADDRYPSLLKKIDDPPPVLYVKGSFQSSDNLSVAIVGSRRCSTYGREQASRFAHILAAGGFTVVSGLARGIDTAAHHGALSSQGRTIAVLGSGLANIFPPENVKLFEMISKNGACISELPLNYEPLSENFPPRNRIIAGLSIATIVIEAASRSGALITANAALEYNREVMAVPGNIDSPLSKGCHNLIKQGAKLVESVDDIMEALGYIGERLKEHTEEAERGVEQKLKVEIQTFPQMKLSSDERCVYDCLSRESLHIEQIILNSHKPAGHVNSSLVSLQLKGLVKQMPGGFYKRK